MQDCDAMDGMTDETETTPDELAVMWADGEPVELARRSPYEQVFATSVQPATRVTTTVYSLATWGLYQAEYEPTYQVASKDRLVSW